MTNPVQEAEAGVLSSLRPHSRQIWTEERKAWLEVIASRGSSAARWAESFAGSDVDEVCATFDESVAVLRRGNLEQGQSLLAYGERKARTVVLDLPCSKDVMERWYFSAAAYLSYLQGDYDKAEGEILSAARAVSSAVTGMEFLLLLALHGYDLTLQLARIARGRRQWDEMWRYVALSREMLLGEKPLCRRGDSQEIWIGMVDDYYTPYVSSQARELLAVQRLLESGMRLTVFERIAQGIAVLPGFVVPF